ncbi:MAG: bifunctional phosphopantothenoylcysteine decarboxylase/phosphopantothenate--cysteine ligase CoaBC [Gammaproteobacteria bacterium]|jgi:phosphopantothenoylcysteine decarboxylase/phosphopantothenate--cysteine ligase
MSSLAQQHILLGVCGGIAAYKSAELVRRLREAGARVRVVMTRSATGFVTAKTFKALSGEAVWSDWSDDRSGMEHIELARWADRIIIAPATADTLARLAHGRADDLLAAVCLASVSPLCVAPAMNQSMWLNAATQHNLALLRGRGVQIWGPDEGAQACGESGPGRMLEPAELRRRLAETFPAGRLSGVRALVTAGPTREAIDPVRFLSNRSSGKMGYAVAEALREAGAEVGLVSGPVELAAPRGVHCTRVESAEEMLEAVMARVSAGCDLFVAAAAVADYRPTRPSPEKIKKRAGATTLALQPAPDILATVATLERRPFCVGFAAETQDLARHARKKRLVKGVDMIAANRVGRGLGFETDDNELLLVWEGGSRLLARDTKARLARQLVACVADVYFQGATERGLSQRHAEHSA